MLFEPAARNAMPLRRKRWFFACSSTCRIKVLASVTMFVWHRPAMPHEIHEWQANKTASSGALQRRRLAMRVHIHHTLQQMHTAVIIELVRCAHRYLARPGVGCSPVQQLLEAAASTVIQRTHRQSREDT